MKKGLVVAGQVTALFCGSIIFAAISVGIGGFIGAYLLSGAIEAGMVSIGASVGLATAIGIVVGLIVSAVVSIFVGGFLLYICGAGELIEVWGVIVVALHIAVPFTFLLGGGAS